MMALAKAKSQVAQQLAIMSKDTVLYESTGQMADADRSTDSVNSYMSVIEGASSKNKMYAEKYKTHVVDYAQNWYTAITERVGAGLKKAETLRVELDHYQAKVEGLRQSANSTMAKGKQVDGKAAEKLTRNEDKLIKIKESSTKFINSLCLLMEEVTERSWRDLHPILIKCSQFETQVTSDEAKAVASLQQVCTALKKIATDNGIKPENRLQDLEKLNPYELSTRSKDDQRNQLAIENGMSGLALGGVAGDGSVFGGSTFSGAAASDNNSSYYPPGSTAAQGLGGFPVAIKSSDISSNGFGHSATSATPSTMSMMNMNAAPAPTLDSMAAAFGSTTSAPSSMGAPSYNRMGSNETFDSGFSGAPAPPPSSAPPPPPPSTPGFPSPGPYGVPASGGPPMMSSSGGSNLFGAPTPSSYPQQQTPMTGGSYGQQQQTPMSRGSYGQQQQTPMTGGSYGHQQQTPMTAGSYGQQQHTPMTAGSYGQQQQTPMTGGSYGQQQSPMGGSFTQQSPMGGSFTQQTPMSMYGNPPPEQKRSSAPATYGYNPTNPFG